MKIFQLLLIFFLPFFLGVAQCDKLAELPFFGAPSSYDVSTYLNSVVSPATADMCRHEKPPEVRDNPKYPFMSPCAGARKLFATKHQSCELLDYEYGHDGGEQTSKKYLKALRKSGKSPKNCTEKIPKNLGYSRKDGSFKLSEDNKLSVSNRIDCSGFISAAFATAGLKMRKGTNNANYRLNTSQISSDYESGESCFKMAGGSPDDIIRKGDIINMPNNHVIMIDRVGSDPFTIEKIIDERNKGTIDESEAKNRCRNLEKSDIDLGIIHSSKTQGGSGIHKMSYNKFHGRTALLILLYAKKACLSFMFGHKTYSHDGYYGLVLRHKGQSDNGCVMKSPPKLTGELCVKDCEKIKEEGGG